MKQVLKYEDLKNKELIVDRSQLSEFFYSGIKPKNLFKTGIEFEKIEINMHDYRAVEYYREKGICEFLKHYKNTGNWEYIREDENVIGLKSNCGVISLEPGSQIEFSSYPQESSTLYMTN